MFLVVKDYIYIYASFFKNRVLKDIFGPKGSGVDTLRSVLLTNYFSGDKIKKNAMGGACSTYG
jgi:hypothetical protein